MAIEMTPEEIEDIFREYNDAVTRGVPIEEDLAVRMRDASAGLRGYTQELKTGLNRLKNSSIGLATALKDGQQGASIYNNSIESGADLLKTFIKPLGPLGRLIGEMVGIAAKVVSAVNAQTDSLYKSYQELNRFGAGITTGVEGVLGLSQQMGYTVDSLGEFSGVLSRSANQLALMGGTVTQGTQDFARLVNNVSDQREMWKRVGVDVATQNEAYGGFIRIMTMQGRMQRGVGNDQELGSQKYLDNLVILGKLTGQTVDELQSQREALMSQQRFASTQRELERKARDAERDGDTAQAARYRNQIDQNFQLINAVPEELRTGVADLMTGFIGTSDASLQVYRGLPAMARMITNQNFQFADVMRAGEIDASKRLDAFGRTLGGTGAFDETFGSLAAYVKLESGAAKDSYQNRLATALAELERQKQLKGATGDQAKMREQQLRTTQAIQSTIGVLQGPVASGLSALATATGSAATALGEIAGTNQRGAAAGPGATPAPTSTTGTATTADLINLRRGRRPAPASDATTAAPAPVAPTAAPASPGAAMQTTAAPTTARPTTAPAAAPAAPQMSLQQMKLKLAVLKSASKRRNRSSTSIARDQEEIKALEEAIGRQTAVPAASSDPPKLAKGGVVSGPTSGYQAMLHGVEAVVPLENNRSIPVTMSPGSGNTNEQQQILAKQMINLEELVKETRTNNQLTQKLIKIAQA